MPVRLSQQESVWASGLTGGRSEQFRRSRSWLRACLSDCLGVPSQRIPLTAPPGMAPSLEPGWGHVSISHTRDALLLGWSREAIGVDIERADRCFNAAALARRFFHPEDRASWTGLSSDALRREVLRQWIGKEAAIKWQKGSLAMDLGRWSWSHSQAHARHPDQGLQVKLRHMTVGHWWLAIANNALEAGQTPMVCLP
ncbi:MAG: 4'-phosphopantetheinyl transferase superfamily protein [Cyanobacteriota bacterium]|nr:4'-phosphopantetheinyl transferase superfamily protein [Cyanobacteriota bacterium]